MKSKITPICVNPAATLNDQMSWIKAQSGACTVKEAFKAISVSASSQQLHPIWSLICKLRVLQKVRLHAWALVLGPIWTNVERVIGPISTDSRCELCQGRGSSYSI